MSVIAKATEAARGGDHARALTLLVDEWRARPNARLADAIDGLSAALGAAPASDADWKNVAKARPPALGPLLASVTAKTAKVATERMAALAEAPADPRLDRWLVSLFETIPYRATSARPFWTRAVKRAMALRDVWAKQRLEQLAAKLRTDDYAEAYLKEQAARVLAKCAPTDTPLTDAAPLEALLAALPKPVATVAGLEVKALATPADEQTQQVVGDALLESGTARGTLMALQARAAPEKEVHRFIDAHFDELVGPLANVVLKRGAAFERGFLSKAVLKLSNPRHVADSVGSPYWSSVKELDVPFSRNVDVRPLLTSPAMKSLAAVRLEHSGLAAEVASGACALPQLTALTVGWELNERDEAVVANLMTCAGLPKLASLSVALEPARLPTFLGGKVVSRLKHFGLVVEVGFVNEGQTAAAAMKNVLTQLAARPLERATLTVAHNHARDVASHWELSLRPKREATLSFDMPAKGPWLDSVLVVATALVTAWKLPVTAQLPARLAASPTLDAFLAAVGQAGGVVTRG